MTSDAVEGEIYPVGFGIEVDAAEVWVSYFNITANAPSGSLVNPSHRINQLCLTNSNQLLPQKNSQSPENISILFDLHFKNVLIMMFT